MSQSTDSNESVVFVAEQYKVTVDVHPPTSPPNPASNVPETQVSGGGPPETTAEDVSVIPETQNPGGTPTANPITSGNNKTYTKYSFFNRKTRIHVYFSPSTGNKKWHRAPV